MFARILVEFSLQLNSYRICDKISNDFMFYKIGNDNMLSISDYTPSQIISRNLM